MNIKSVSNTSIRYHIEAHHSFIYSPLLHFTLSFSLNKNNIFPGFWYSFPPLQLSSSPSHKMILQASDLYYRSDFSLWSGAAMFHEKCYIILMNLFVSIIPVWHWVPWTAWLGGWGGRCVVWPQHHLPLGSPHSHFEWPCICCGDGDGEVKHKAKI